MPWPLPTPTEIAEQLAADLEQALGPLAPDGEVDARGANTVLGVLARVQAMAAWQQHLHLRGIADDLLPSTASAERLPLHAAVWGVERVAAAIAAGTATVAGANGTQVLKNAQLLGPGDALYTVTRNETVSGGVATLKVEAATAGAAGNQPAGTVLRFVAPIVGLSAQTATVAAPGLTGGRAEEEIEAWRARVIARIRAGARGGTLTDYEGWARRAAGVAKVAVRAEWTGLGYVGVIVAMEGGAAPSADDLARVVTEIEAERPVTARVAVVAAVPTAIDLTLEIDPDTTAVRTAITNAFAAFLAREPAIGGTIRLSRLSEALSSAAEEYAHRIITPTADVELETTELAIAGTITWREWTE